MEEKNYLLNAKKNDHRLKKNSQFNYIFRKGERQSSKNFALYQIKSKFANNYKIGFSVSKKIGKAWKRNLLKRRLKNIILLNNLPQNGFNYIVQAKIGAGELDYKEIERQIKFVFEKGKRVED